MISLCLGLFLLAWQVVCEADSLASLAATEFSLVASRVDAVLVFNSIAGSSLAAITDAFRDEHRIVVTAKALLNHGEVADWVLFKRPPRALKCLSVPAGQPTVHRFAVAAGDTDDVVAWVNDVMQWHERERVMRFLERAQRNPRKCRVVDDAPTDQAVFDALASNQPTVFRGAALDWPARQLWTADRLREQSGDVLLSVKASADGRFEGVESAADWPEQRDLPAYVRQHLAHPELVTVRAADVALTMRELLDTFSSSSNETSLYLEYTSFDAIPMLAAGVPRPLFPFAGFLQRSHLNVWLGDGRTTGKLHFDEYENVLAQVVGRKVFKLISANNRSFESHIREVQFEYDRSHGKLRRSRLLESTSMTMAPFANVRDDEVFTCNVEPGDVFVLPAFTWHEVQSERVQAETINLMVNAWFAPLRTREFVCPTCDWTFDTARYRDALIKFGDGNRERDEL
jgi:jumonji domain-containing protein 7